MFEIPDAAPTSSTETRPRTRPSRSGRPRRTTDERILVLGAGFGVMAGRTWARVVGIVLAGLSALANLAFIAAYPIWSVIVIAVDTAVIFALTTYRRPSEA